MQDAVQVLLHILYSIYYNCTESTYDKHQLDQELNWNLNSHVTKQISIPSDNRHPIIGSV